MSDLHDVVARAVSLAALAVTPEESDKSFLEKRLEAKLAAILHAARPGLEVVVRRRVDALQLPNWDPKPYPFDISLLDGERVVAAIEVKVDDVDDTLWDIFKLASASAHAGVEATYMVMAGRPPAWKRPLAQELYSGEEVERYTRHLFEKFSGIWKRTLERSSPRPTSLPFCVLVAESAREEATAFAGYEVRALRVTGVGPPSIDIRDGWPVEAPKHGAQLPSPDASEAELHRFALDLNAYELLGSFAACAAVANPAKDAWRKTGELPASDTDLRVCLFFEQRRFHHFGTGFDDETLHYARTIVERMRSGTESAP